MRTRIASFGMYDPSWLHEANDRLWAVLAGMLSTAGIEGVPERLDREHSLNEIWQADDLLLAQTCGYPWRKSLGGRVRYVVTPHYELPHVAMGEHCSVVVVPATSAADTLEELRGQILALNGRDSNSGMNLLRALIAPLAKGRPFFSRVLITGSHLGSMAAVSGGYAGVAAIDAITYGQTARHRPDLVDELRVLAVTPASPGLPFITSGTTTDRELAILRQALHALIESPALTRERQQLCLAGFVQRDEADYDRILTLEDEACRLNYPTLL